MRCTLLHYFACDNTQQSSTRLNAQYIRVHYIRQEYVRVLDAWPDVGGGGDEVAMMRIY